MTEFDFVCRYVASVAGNGQANNINIECALQAYKQIRGLLKREGSDHHDPEIHGTPMEPGIPINDGGSKLTDDVPLIDGDSPIEVRNNAISDYEDYSGLISTGKIDVRNLNMNTVVKCLEHMIGLYSERRTDVADICWEILEGKTAQELRDPEHRYINASIEVDGKNVEVLYDTLTTLIEYRAYDEDEKDYIWITSDDHVYRDEELKDQPDASDT